MNKVSKRYRDTLIFLFGVSEQQCVQQEIRLEDRKDYHV